MSNRGLTSLFSRPSIDCASQEKVRENVVVRGKKEDAVSELEAGRRTIVRDPDDPVQQADILDNLMISREEDIEEELRAAYMPVRAAAASAAVTTHGGRLMVPTHANFHCNYLNVYHSGR